MYARIRVIDFPTLLPNALAQGMSIRLVCQFVLIHAYTCTCLLASRDSFLFLGVEDSFLCAVGGPGVRGPCEWLQSSGRPIRDMKLWRTHGRSYWKWCGQKCRTASGSAAVCRQQIPPNPSILLVFSTFHIKRILYKMKCTTKIWSCQLHKALDWL